MYVIANGMFARLELSFGYLIGMPYVNHPISMAMLPLDLAEKAIVDRLARRRPSRESS